MPASRESPITASCSPPTRDLGPAATGRPASSKLLVSAVASAAATNAGAASSADDKTGAVAEQRGQHLAQRGVRHLDDQSAVWCQLLDGQGHPHRQDVVIA